MLELSHIYKRFNLKQAAELQQQDPRIQGRFFNALADVSLKFEAGQVVGLLGANGAGKTTLLRILSTALKADRGQVLFNGENIQTQLPAYRKNIGFLPGTSGLYQRLSGYENLAYFGRLYGLSESHIKQRINELTDLLDLSGFIQRRLSDYSTGMKQRIAIARCVLHTPGVVILDEPTTGLDIIAKEVILKFIEQMQSQNVSIIFSTHDMAEVERLCETLVVINQGRSVYNGSIDTLKAETGYSQLQKALLSLIGSEQEMDLSL